MLMLGLLVVAAIAVFGFIMRKRAAGQFGGNGGLAYAGAGASRAQTNTFRAPLATGGSAGGSMIGSAIGGQDHMKVMVLAQAAGVDPLTLRYTPFDGGGEAMTAMLGGFVDVFPGDVSEVLGQLEAG